MNAIKDFLDSAGVPLQLNDRVTVAGMRGFFRVTNFTEHAVIVYGGKAGVEQSHCFHPGRLTVMT